MDRISGKGAIFSYSSSAFLKSPAAAAFSMARVSSFSGQAALQKGGSS